MLGAIAKTGTGLADRLVWLGLLAGATCVLVAARLLEPAAAGFGTHRQLGLPPCGFLVLTNMPCPACGLTTAFAHLARLDLVAAVHANPMGVPLFLLNLAVLPLALHGLLRSRSVMQVIDQLEADKWALCFVAVTLAVWAARLAAVLG